MSILDATVSLFQGARENYPLEVVPLRGVLEAIRCGDYRDEVQAARRLTGNPRAYRAAKEKLVAFTPGCALSTRDKDVAWSAKLVSTTGLVYYDFDHLDDPADFGSTEQRYVKFHRGC